MSGYFTRLAAKAARIEPAAPAPAVPGAVPLEHDVVVEVGPEAAPTLTPSDNGERDRREPPRSALPRDETPVAAPKQSAATVIQPPQPTARSPAPLDTSATTTVAARTDAAGRVEPAAVTPPRVGVPVPRPTDVLPASARRSVPGADEPVPRTPSQPAIVETPRRGAEPRAQTAAVMQSAVGAIAAAVEDPALASPVKTPAASAALPALATERLESGPLVLLPESARPPVTLRDSQPARPQAAEVRIGTISVDVRVSPPPAARPNPPATPAPPPITPPRFSPYRHHLRWS